MTAAGGRRLSARAAVALMAGIAVARGTSFLMSKDLLASVPPLCLIGLRFLLAFAVLLAVFLPRVARSLRGAPRIAGAAAGLGAIYFACMACELTGLRLSTVTTCSLIENSAVVIVPLAEAALARRLPAPAVAVGAGLAFAGICLVVTGGAAPGAGGADTPAGIALCAASALTFAAAIMATDRLSKRYDPVALGVLYVGALGAMGSLSSLAFESPAPPADGVQWAELAGLALVCTAFGFAMQPMAQEPLSSEAAGMICALNPLTTAVLGWALAMAAPGVAGVAGAVLIIAGIALPNVPGAVRGRCGGR